MCFSLSLFAQPVPRLVHMDMTTTALSTRAAVWMVSVEKSAAAALSITSAVRTNAVTRMAIAMIALYSRLQPL